MADDLGELHFVCGSATKLILEKLLLYTRGIGQTCGVTLPLLLARFSRYKRPLFYALTALMAYIAAQRLAFVFPHLTDGFALDLGSCYRAVEIWFGGHGLHQRSSSTYPPASYLLFWPFLGWLPWEAASRLWAVLCALSLGILAIACARHEPIASHSARWLGAMTMLALTATSSVIWLGQSVSLLMCALIAATWLLHPSAQTPSAQTPSAQTPSAQTPSAQTPSAQTPSAQTPSAQTPTVWARELGAGALLLFVLVKPSVAAPFLWMILWAPRDAEVAAPLSRRIGLGIGVLIGYGALTWAALYFQNDAGREVADWAHTVNRNNAQLSEGYANLRAWLAAIGLKPWSHPLSLLVLLWLGFWTFRHRHLDRLLLLSVTALVARLWTYHNLYDDLLLAIPMLLLLQIGAGRAQPTRRNWANGLLVALVALLLTPPYWMFDRAISNAILPVLLSLTLVATLIFLLRLAKSEKLC